MEEAAAPGPLGPAATSTATTTTEERTTKLPCFKGEEPLETFLRQVLLAASLHRHALEDKVLQALVDLLPVEQASCPAIKGAFQHRYSPKVFSDDACDDLAIHHQSGSESLGAYDAALHLHAHRGYPALNDIRLGRVSGAHLVVPNPDTSSTRPTWIRGV